jgi:hypothetical protein
MMVGTSTVVPLSMQGANFAASASWVKYSSQPEESINQSSESVVAVTVIVFPFHPFGDSAKFGHGAQRVQM